MTPFILYISLTSPPNFLQVQYKKSREPFEAPASGSNLRLSGSVCLFGGFSLVWQIGVLVSGEVELLHTEWTCSIFHINTSRWGINQTLITALTFWPVWGKSWCYIILLILHLFGCFLWIMCVFIQSLFSPFRVKTFDCLECVNLVAFVFVFIHPPK